MTKIMHHHCAVVDRGLFVEKQRDSPSERFAGSIHTGHNALSHVIGRLVNDWNGLEGIMIMRINIRKLCHVTYTGVS